MAEENIQNLDTNELDETKKQRDEYLAGWQRAKADFSNYRKEEMKHLQEVAQYGSEDLIKDLILILDDFDLALRIKAKQNSAKSNPQADGIEEGILLIRSKLGDTLKKRGLLEIPLKVGDQFDSSIAEAMMEIDSDKQEGTVIEVIQIGYRLGDKILRPARVVISKGK